MFTIRSIRAKARETVSQTPGIYLLALVPVLINLVTQLISSAPTDASSLEIIATDPAAASNYLLQTSAFPFLVSILLAFLFLSLYYSIFQVVRKQKEATGFKDSIAIFSHPQFGKIFATVFLKGLLLFVWGLLFYIGLFLLVVSVTLFFVMSLMTMTTDPSLFPEEVMTVISGAGLAGFLLFVGGLALYFPQVYAYSQVEMILFDRLEKGEYTSASAIIKESRRIMKGYKGKRFVLDLSFIGWNLLAVISLGLAGVYVFPYYYAAQVHFYQAVLADRQERGLY